MRYDLDSEWLEADGLGGFACGTVGLLRTRRYHALLLVATSPPTGRMVLVNGLDAWVETPAGRCALSAQRYEPDVIHPDGRRSIVAFEYEPWPAWRFAFDGGGEIAQELIVRHERPETLIRWRLIRGPRPVRLTVRLFLSGRDYHALHRENPAFRFEPAASGKSLIWRPYDGVPAIQVLSNGAYRHEPCWYRRFAYAAERERGFDHLEDLASPGCLSWDLADAEAHLVLRAATGQAGAAARSPAAYARDAWRREEARRRRYAAPLDRAADAYVVRRGRGRTIIAGYPWFTDWGRDTFIALRGLCDTPERLPVARDVLSAWADAVSEGMLPNRFVDAGEVPEFNAVDASLWYVVAVHDFLELADRAGEPVRPAVLRRLRHAVREILRGYARGTRYAIHADADGLLAAGVPGVQLTWMDARIGEYVVTPRIGKPVEVQALWLNALRIASRFDPQFGALFERGAGAFVARFWRPDAGCLFDVVDADHVPGRVDVSFRPNQVFAVGGLPLQLLAGERARRLVDAVEARLWTPMGLRSLAPDDPAYRPRYAGGPAERDAAYHQGTVWPWLIGPFVEAWLRVRGNTPEARMEARRRFLTPLFAHLETAGLGHVSEVADGDPPHTPGGCPFQAWSLAALRYADRLCAANGPSPAPRE